MEELRKPVKKNRHNDRPSTSQFCQCSSSSLPAESTNAALVAAAVKQSFEHGYDFNSLVPPTIQQTLPFPDKTSQKSQENKCSVYWRRSRLHKGIRRRKLIINLVGRRSIPRNKKETLVKTSCSQDQFVASENSREEIDFMSQDNICDSDFTSASLSTRDSQHHKKERSSHSKNEYYSTTSLSQKYQPKLFEDIAGHEITIKAISNAVMKKKIAHLYLFHGPSGTGKTSAARIFVMALNCESSSDNKPCWNCRGCSRSLYIMGLCSGSKTTGFQRISTLLQSTSFIQAIPGFKVFIIEECHSLTAERWDELLGTVEGKYGSTVVFVLITAYANMVPRTVSSRCQKFFFPKLKNTDITLKLARIAAREDVRIEREALKLIIAKAEGSMREAENILDQLTLLGPRITGSLVQQIVGLIPENQLIDLLETALSGNTKKTIKLTRELIATRVEPQAFVSQLAHLITDILSSAAVTVSDSATTAGPSKEKTLQISELTNIQSERLCIALKILVEIERQPRSIIDQNAWIFAALLQIASQDISNRASPGIFLPGDVILPSGDIPNAEPLDIQQHRSSHSKSWENHHSTSRSPERQKMDKTDVNSTSKGIEKSKRCRGKAVQRERNLACMSDVEEIWLHILEKIQSRYMKEFLCHRVKLASVTFSAANAIVHLMFKRLEDKLAAQMSEESISKALEHAIGCSVTVNVSLEPVELGIMEENTASTNKSQIAEHFHSRNQQRTSFLLEPVCSTNLGPTATHSSTQQQKLTSRLDENLKLTKFKDSKLTTQGRNSKREAIPFQPQGLTQENQLDASVDPKNNSLIRDQPPVDTVHFMKTQKPKHRWLSLSSIQQSDASVEPYSQDILFENAKTEKVSRTRKNPKFQKGLSKASEDNRSKHTAKTIGLYSSWSCKGLLFQRKTKDRNHAA